MTQTHKGAIQEAARRCGLTIEEYNAHRQANRKWCHYCGYWKATDQFGKDRNRSDGLHAMCRPCRVVYSAERYRATKALTPRPKRR